MIDGDGDKKEKFDIYSNISNSYSKDTLINDDIGSTDTLIPDSSISDSASSIVSEKTLVNELNKMSLLPGELGITREELEKLNYKELIVIREAINREYDARAKEFEGDIKESINIELEKLKGNKIFINRVVESEQMNNGIVMNITKKDMLRGQKREALVEIARLWQMIKEQRTIRDRKREQLLGECDIFVNEKEWRVHDDTIENQDILKTAVLNVLKTVKLDDSEVNEDLYKELIDEDIKRSEMEQDEFYDSMDTEQKDLKRSIMDLHENVNDEVVLLKHYQNLLESEIWKLKGEEYVSDVEELVRSYGELEAYINIYKEQQNEVNNILITYNECDKTGILFEKENMLSDNVVKAIDEQVTQMMSLIDKTRLTISRRVEYISNKIQDVEKTVKKNKVKTEQKYGEKDELDVVLTKESLYIINAFGMGLLAANKNMNEIRAMTTEERFLAKELEISQKELEINDYKNTSWRKELFTTASILYQLIRNKDSRQIRNQISQYKINNEDTVDAIKNKISDVDKKEYNNYEYKDAIKIVEDGLYELIHSGNKVDIDRLTSKDCQVLAQMFYEESTRKQEERAKDMKKEVLSNMEYELREHREIFNVVENGYNYIGKSTSSVYKHNNRLRDAFNVIIAQKDALGTAGIEDEVSQSKLIELGIVDTNSYTDYVSKYEKEHMTTQEDIENMLQKIRDASVGGGYYYIVLDDERNDLVFNIGEPVISSKGITIFKVDENRLNFEQASGKFLETIFDDNHDFSESIKDRHKKIELQKDRMYIVEQDREFDKTMQLIEDEESMLSENNLFGMYRDNGTPKLSSGLERKVKYADVTLDMLKYIHTREGNTEYDEEEKLINGLSDRLTDLKNAFKNQHNNIKRLNSALNAYRKFKSNIDMKNSTEVDDKIRDIFYGEYKKAKDDFLSLSDYIKAKANDLFAYQYNIDNEKFKIDIRQEKVDKKEQSKESNVEYGFFGKLKKFFIDMIKSIKDKFKSVMQLFTPRGIKVKVNDLITTAIGVDNSKGSREGMKQWVTELWTMDNALYKDEYMKLAKKRDEENRKKAIDDKEGNSVSLNGVSTPEKSHIDGTLDSKKFGNSVKKVKTVVEKNEVVVKSDVPEIVVREIDPEVRKKSCVSFEGENKKDRSSGGMNK